MHFTYVFYWKDWIKIGTVYFYFSKIQQIKINLNSKIPIVVKIAPDINDDEIKKISEVLINNEVEAIIISNTSDETREKLKDIQKRSRLK